MDYGTVFDVVDISRTQHSSTALERLQVSLAFDIEAVHEVLEELRQSLTVVQGEGEHGTRCIVIDSITPLLGPMLSATSSQGEGPDKLRRVRWINPELSGHATMTTFMRQLRALAELFHLTVIVSGSNGSLTSLSRRTNGKQVINSSTSLGKKNPKPWNPEAVFEIVRKPALGPSFTFLTDVALWLTKRRPDPGDKVDEGSTLHTVEVLRSRTTVRHPISRTRYVTG